MNTYKHVIGLLIQFLIEEIFKYHSNFNIDY